MASRRSLLVAEEARLAAQLSAVRCQLNELAPIGVLPTEILEHIFHVCVSWLYRPTKPRYPLAWTQVCRLWRSVSFDSARLWQTIDLADRRYAREFLTRSREAPISFYTTSPLKVSTETLGVHAQRLSSIDVFLFPDDMLQLFSNLGRQLPILSTLSLKIPPVSSTFILETPLPALRRLSLDLVAVPWISLSDLTHLSLRGLRHKFSPSVSQLHHIFSQSPSLEYIRLDAILPDDLQVPHSTTPLLLPHLHDFILSANAPVIAAILSPMSFSPLTRLQLSCASFDDLRTYFPQGLPFIHHLHIKGLRFARHASRFLRTHAPPWSEDPKDMQFTLDSNSCIATPFLLSLPLILNLSQITFLEFNTGVLLDLSLPALQSFLLHTPNIQILRTAFNVLQDLLTVLTQPHPTTHTYLLPLLHTLSFSKPGDIWWHFAEQWQRAVIVCAKNRKENQVGLRRVEFTKCHGVKVGGMMGEELKGVVEVVVVMEVFEVGKLQSGSLFAGSF
ncbi:hypothetical protein AGABI2DRAFT_200536 [Agaricus bisporus var. bisporus H97]|uniref:hypothetical protein n=1 Tax=Agaricus bisporus var. bisporus (strain H97 / ATCC MYA-4626 / FGSC 10389) TaxID=936046 RepID=UPI00029F7757|nr:hypothetical protein AGABI2DRAFT_200536 [Agaricus bisporus var. bisporus H97]EKV50674.1 hypothetical protein AGABI2DRAFT_200536 [Agaricus bisporus var. bisporus H97]